MPPTIVLVRHAQAEHNVACDWSLPDPSLTPLGRQQASTIPSAYPALFEGADVILTSPLRRTMQTTLWGFPKLKEGGVPLEIWPELQETQDHPCDRGSSRQALEAEFKEAFCDFSNCYEGWTAKKGKFAPTLEALRARALEVRRSLKKRKEQRIVVVCHAGFLRHIVQLPHSHIWNNCEARVYRFAETVENGVVERQDASIDGQTDPDTALLERVSTEEELEILGGPNAELVASH